MLMNVNVIRGKYAIFYLFRPYCHKLLVTHASVAVSTLSGVVFTEDRDEREDVPMLL